MELPLRMANRRLSSARSRRVALVPVGRMETRPCGTRLEMRLLSGAGGAEISASTWRRISTTARLARSVTRWNEHCRLLSRPGRSTPNGEGVRPPLRRALHPSQLQGGIGDDPEIVMVRREPGDTSYVGEDWHADTTMVAEPPMGAISTASTCRPTAATPCSPISISPTTHLVGRHEGCSTG